MENGMVSIVVINYNNAEYLSRCILSLAAQSYRNKEIICIDDGSKDRSKEILESLSLIVPGMSVHCCENGGISAARNRGVRLAKGEFLMFADSDDWFEPDMVSGLVNAIRSSHDIDLACGSYVHEYGSWQLSGPAGRNRIYTKEKALHLLMKNTFINNYAWGKLYRTKLFRTIEYPEGRDGYEDIQTTYRYMALCRKVSVIHNRSVHYVHHEQSVTAAMPNEKVDLLIRDFKEQEQALNELFPDEHFSSAPMRGRMKLLYLWNMFRYPLSRQITAQKAV